MCVCVCVYLSQGQHKEHPLTYHTTTQKLMKMKRERTYLCVDIHLIAENKKIKKCL